jgi:hypothetical protein
MSKLHAAYLFNIVDSYRYLSDRVPLTQYDYRPILDMKQASIQKGIQRRLNAEYTWNNTDKSILHFLDASSFPEDLPSGASAGYLVASADKIPEIQTGTTANLTTEIIAETCLEFYLECILQLCDGDEGHEDYVKTTDYESPFRNDPSLWAVTEPGVDDQNNFFNAYSQVLMDIGIPPSSEWLALTPLVVTESADQSNLTARFTAYGGTVHYYYRVMNGISGRVSEIVEPQFINWQQLNDRIDKVLLMSQVDLLEEVGEEMEIDSNSILGSLTQDEITYYYYNTINFIYNAYCNMMVYSMPSGTFTIAGMSSLPNPNFSSSPLPTMIVENLENLGQVDIGALKTRRARRIAIPVLYARSEVKNFFGTAHDFDYYNNMFVGREIEGELSPNVGTSFQIYPSLRCFTRGTFVQTLWIGFPNDVAQLFNTSVASGMESLRTDRCDYDKMVLTFHDDSQANASDSERAVNRHFLGYELKHVSLGERNLLRLLITPVFELGTESLTVGEKEERVRTIQLYFDLPSSEYVDSTREPGIEVPNTLCDNNNLLVSYFRRFKYSENDTDRAVHAHTVLMKGEGGNFFATVRSGFGKILHTASRASRALIGNPLAREVVSGLAEAAANMVDPGDSLEVVPLSRSVLPGYSPIPVNSAYLKYKEEQNKSRDDAHSEEDEESSGSFPEVNTDSDGKRYLMIGNNKFYLA